MKTIVMSLGGSTVVPGAIDVSFLIKFKALILKYTKKGYRFIIIVGGGRTCRDYQKAASEVTKLHPEDVDWLGIHATRLNAHLLRTIFRDQAYPRLVKNPHTKAKFKEQVVIAAGWKPGFSTDYDAVVLAKNHGVKLVINLTNQDYVYDKDPKKFKDAKPLKKLTWSEFRKIVGDKWSPGLNAPFDPVASRLAQKNKLKVVILKGTKIPNLEKCIQGKSFVGTTIS